MDENRWISDFLRQSVLGSGASSHIGIWAGSFLEALREAKPDQEIQIFGVSRIPRMPNYLLASTSEQTPGSDPIRIQVTEKTADLFLSPTEPGVRMLQQEWPMTVFHDAGNAEGEAERRELSFYEAICFDGVESSIILGLILNEGTLSDFLTAEEISELLPLVRAQGITQYELFIYRNAHKTLEMEVELMTGLVRESSPELLAISTPKPAGEKQEDGASLRPRHRKESDNIVLTPAFFQYTAKELRTSLEKVLATPEARMTLNDTEAGPSLDDQTSALKGALEHQKRLIKNLGNIAALMQPNVRPQQDVIGLQKFMHELEPLARRCGQRHGVRVDVDEHTRNIFAAGDEKTILRVLSRLMEFQFPLCRGGQCWIRIDEDPKRGEQGYVMLEVEDDGKIPAGVGLETLLQRVKQHGEKHPRLKNGGAILFQFITMFLEKSGGEFRLAFGLNGGFAAQFLLPKVSRAEMERARGKAAASAEGLG